MYSLLGLNQAWALSQLLPNVRFLGIIGQDGLWVRDELASIGFDTSYMIVHPAEKTGQTIIQVPKNNSCSNNNNKDERFVILFSGANRALKVSDIEAFLHDASPGDLFLIQHETNLVEEALQIAKAKGMTTV